MSKYTPKNLLDYFPEFLRETGEYIAFCEAVDPELKLLQQRVEAIENNITPLYADEHGITMFEEWLGIVTNPYLPLEERRATVIAKLNETLPYTEIRLQRLLAAIVGWGHFIYKRNGAFVQVILDQESYSAINPVMDMLERILPMNLHYEVLYGVTNFATEVKTGSAGQETVIITTPINIDNKISHVYMGTPYSETIIIETEVENG